MTFEIVDLREHHSSDEENNNKNSQICEYLKKVVEHIKAEMTLTNDSKKKKSYGFKMRSIIKATSALENHEEVITSGKQAMTIPGIGKGIAQRIDEILTTGKLKELETIGDNYVRLIRELTRISGIGLVKAQKLISDFEITSLEDLVEKYNKGEIKIGKNQLTHHQVVGLKYADDFEQKIPRAEIDEIKKILEKEFPKIDGGNLIFEICGSYRRGKTISGDIDILVSSSSSDPQKHILKQIVEHFTEIGLIIDNLTEDGKTKYMGVCKLNDGSVARRIDIRMIPQKNWAAARLYFTGSGQFNVQFRALALQRHFTVNEYGIFHFENGLKGEQIDAATEEDIFKIVGGKYLTPLEREF
jgi:DNA polymerase/3'-5' exonuclease PolX